MLARVTEILLDKYALVPITNEFVVGQSVNCIATIRKNAKKSVKIKVGDIVEYEKIDNDFVITEIKKRKNECIRPPVANIDYIYIVAAVKNPDIDYTLIDKQLILAAKNNITPAIILNKIDLEQSKQNTKESCVYEEAYKLYTGLGYKVIPTSVLEGKEQGIENMIEVPAGSLCVFSGNSGVGKSSIISYISKSMGDDIEIGHISSKTKKGRHTTKSVKIYETVNKAGHVCYILDTPGFSSFELLNIEATDLKKYYPEFKNIECEYLDCNHINESSKECGVKKAVETGYIDKNRYDRFSKMYLELKEKEKKKYR